MKSKKYLIMLLIAILSMRCYSEKINRKIHPEINEKDLKEAIKIINKSLPPFTPEYRNLKRFIYEGRLILIRETIYRDTFPLTLFVGKIEVVLDNKVAFFQQFDTPMGCSSGSLNHPVYRGYNSKFLQNKGKLLIVTISFPSQIFLHIIEDIDSDKVTVNSYNSAINCELSKNIQIFVKDNIVYIYSTEVENEKNPIIFMFLGHHFEQKSMATSLISPYVPKDLSLEQNKLSKYEQFLAEYEKKMMEKLITENPKLKMTANDVKKAIESFRRQNNNIKLTEIFKTKLTDEQLKEKLCNDKNMQFNLSFSNWVEKNHRKYSEITVSEAEIMKFYNDYKWAFIKDLKAAKREYYSLKNKHKFIKNEIKRLKYYRLDELLANPPKVELNTK